MKTRFARIIGIALIIACLLGAAPVSAGGDSEPASLINAVISHKTRAAGAASVQEWLDDTLAAGAGSASDWYAIALAQYDGTLDFGSYADALEAFCAENGTAGAVSRQKYALALIACGRASSGVVSKTACDSIGEQGVMSWIFGLHLINNGAFSDKYDAAQIEDRLLEMQLPDGGWAVSGRESDTDVTAMAIQALAPHYDTDGEVCAAIDLSLGFLSDKQLPDGGYKSCGVENAESCAQVITALCALGVDPLTDARFIKNGCSPLDGLLKYRLEDGGFCHTAGGGENKTATVQALCGFVSLWRLHSGKAPLFSLDKAGLCESPPPEPTTADTASKPEGYKLPVCLGILAAALVACLVLIISRRRNLKNFLFVLLVSAVLAAVVLLTDIQSAESYYRKDSADPADAAYTVTLSIRCDTVSGKSDSEYIPRDGVILPATEFSVKEGDTVYDVLTRAARENGIQLDSSGGYVSGIGYLYELRFGDLSGWVYHVNGLSPSVGCGDYALSDGDTVEWLYTLDLGNDVK